MRLQKNGNFREKNHNCSEKEREKSCKGAQYLLGGAGNQRQTTFAATITTMYLINSIAIIVYIFLFYFFFRERKREKEEIETSLIGTGALMCNGTRDLLMHAQLLSPKAGPYHL